DVFVIFLFTTFVGMAQGGSASAWDVAGIPLSILAGIALGAAAGWLLARFFEGAFARGHLVRGSLKVIVVLGVSFLLVAAEGWLAGVLPLSGLMAVMAMACVLQR
ncbi:sodium:proton antiporter, partial [Bittarella massiliensis]|nr:sodium:proton antiporter [Bittarella massiliensis (ex Durand et al. 2017)]